jgi:hypothetical protein
MLLTFISTVVATGLVLAVVVSERSRATEELPPQARAGSRRKCRSMRNTTP